MISKINGLYYTNLILYGIKNLERYRTVLNDLNVFPVPDGDTGTNMVMTLRYGYDTIKNKEGSLAEISQQFSSSAVFGARGNSGVIVSQFFKGLTEVFKDVKEADCEVFAKALQSGCKFAYASVSNPVEGTMLTVLKDASNAVIKSLPIQSVNELIDVFLSNAKTSLAHTPELLPILKKASVVDSGGSGIVYFFEGVKKCLNGEEIETTDAEEEIAVTEQIDLSIFNKDTDFHYGYCVEGLIQLKVDENDFEFNSFKDKLIGYGNSVVVSLEGDKVKIHIHVKKLGNLMDFCQKYGEFLTIKIENMTVQNLQKEVLKQEAQKFLYNAEREETDFAVIAVATNQQMQQCFFEMGADVVILSEIAPSSQDFMDAFKLANCKNVLVFPNSANSILSSMQAGSLYKNSKVIVLNSRSIAECYATLSILDYNSAIDEAVEIANDTLSNIYQCSIYHAIKDVKFGSKKINKNEFFALHSNTILDVKETLEAVTINTIDSVLKKQDHEVITLFYGKYISPEYIDILVEKINALNYEVEIAIVPTYETVYDITLNFE